MTQDNSAETSDLGEDIVQDKLPEHIDLEAVGKRAFKPWHRVHKQFIRERQWNHEIAYLVKQLRRTLQKNESDWGEVDEIESSDTPISENLRIERPLRFFTLPGEDLLDVRCLWDALRSEEIYLRFLGFDATMAQKGSGSRTAIAEAAVTQLSRVAKNSTVVASKFQDIAQKNTQAWQYFRRYGPYDVVNLDLCNSLVPRGVPGEITDQVNAVMSLLEYQNQFQRGIWLLFITTQVDRDTVDQVEMNMLAGPTRANCEQHPDFAGVMSERVPDAFSGADHQCDISKLSADQLVSIFGVVVGKWLCSVLVNANPRWTVKMLRTYRYVIKQDTKVQMLSMGFKLIPHISPPIDKTGLSNLKTVSKPVPSELELAMQMLEASRSVDDVDQLLLANENERQRLVQAQAELLAGAGYDKVAYLKWVELGEQHADW